MGRGRATPVALLLALGVISCPGAPASAASAPPCTTQSGGGDWPSYGHDPADTRTQPAERDIGPRAAAGLGAAWVFSTASTGDDSGFTTTPVVHDGCVFIGSTGGVAYALDATTGHVVWQRKLDDFSSSAGGAITGAAAIAGQRVILLVSGPAGPYAVALDRSSGALLWKTPPYVTGPGNQIQIGYYTNASPVVANGLVAAGYSASEGDAHKSGGFALIDVRSGRIVKVTPTIPLADQAKGYAGGGLWSTPAYDPATQYLFWGSGNPYSKQQEHPYTNAILKIDVDRARPTFGQVVASYKGNVDQYSSTLQALSHTPACAASDNPSLPYPTDDPACGQVDLDFGASANLFRTSSGTELVGELQKSGVYHVAHADTMAPAWTALVGATCQTCNAASTAFYRHSIYAIGEPDGLAFSLAADTGATNWLAPIADGPHYQSISAADGVVWTADSYGNLDAFDAVTGQVLARRPLAADTHAPVVNETSSGVAIAEHALFVAAGGFVYEPTAGYVIAYRAGG